MYDLIAVVIHCGRLVMIHSILFNLLSNHISIIISGPTRGHYITIVKSHNRWLSFDDEYVEVTSEFSCIFIVFAHRKYLHIILNNFMDCLKAKEDK